MPTKFRSLQWLHVDVGVCRLCDGLVTLEKASRPWASVVERSEILIVGQALGEKTQRESGVPYFLPNGELWRTGLELEKFLARLGHTLYPPQAVQLAGGEIAPASGLRPVYCTEIIQCYPGRAKGGGHNFPPEAARRCLSAGYLAEEIRLVDPNLIVLLGAKTYDCFWRHFLGRKPGSDGLPSGLEKTLEAIIQSGELPVRTVLGRDRALVPVIHPSGQTIAKFRRLVEANEPLITLLQDQLRSLS
jgi:uracil-DNA glycosylase